MNSKDQLQDGAIQIVDQQEGQDVNFAHLESGEYPNRFGNTEPVARQDLRSFDDVSLGSPAATMMTIKSSQATYNTNAMLVRTTVEAH